MFLSFEFFIPVAFRNSHEQEKYKRQIQPKMINQPKWLIFSPGNLKQNGNEWKRTKNLVRFFSNKCYFFPEI